MHMRAMESEKKYTGLAAFDLDGTLLDGQSWRITPSALDAIARLRARGYCFVLATGRDMYSRYAREYLQQLNPDAVVHMNGTRVEAGGQLLMERLMDKALLQRVLDFAQAEGLSVGCHLDNVDYFTWPERLRQHDLAFWGSCERNFAPASELPKLPVRALSYAGGREGAERLQAAFPMLKVKMFSASTGADIFEAQCSKAEGIFLICDYWQIDRKATYAFGDSANDIEMLERMAVGIAMGSAQPEVKAAADYVTERIEQDGVWKACVHFGLI